MTFVAQGTLLRPTAIASNDTVFVFPRHARVIIVLEDARQGIALPDSEAPFVSEAEKYEARKRRGTIEKGGDV